MTDPTPHHHLCTRDGSINQYDPCELCVPYYSKEVVEELRKQVAERKALLAEKEKLATENAELKEKCAAAELDIEAEKECYEDTNRALNHVANELSSAKATIEALNLRVARLVDALNSISATTGEYLLFTAKSTDLSKEYHKTRKSLSAERDQQWLREKQAEAFDVATDSAPCDASEKYCRSLASELRQQKEGKNA